MSFFQTTQSTSQQAPPSCLRQFKQNHRKQIRRQYIQTYQKNKRKQLFKNNERFFVPQTSKKEQEFMKYVENLTVQAMQADPNNHLTYLNDLIYCDLNADWIKDKLGVVIVLVHKLVERMVRNARGRIDCLKQALREADNEEDSFLEHQIIADTLVYNQVFFQPLCNTTQLYFKQTNPYNPLQQSISQQNTQQHHNHIQELQKKKLNICLFLQFLIAVTYEITPDMFVKSLKKNGFAHSVASTNGHDGVYGVDLSNSYNEEAMVHNRALTKMIEVYQDLSNLCLCLYKVAKNIRYQNGTLLQLSNKLRTLYQNNPLLQKPLTLPFLWFDVQKMFVKQSTQQKITSRVLQYLINLTSLVSMNDQFDGFIHGLCLLQYFDEQASDDVAFEENEIRQISSVYANLVSEEISWAVGHKEQVKERIINSNRIEIEQQEAYNEHNYLSFSPGIHLHLLQVLSNNWTALQKIDDMVYIVKTILENYDLPKSAKSAENQSDDFGSELKLVMYPPDCEQIASIVAYLFEYVTANEVESEFLSDLFVLVCQKLLPYLLYAHQLSNILALVIKNQNKRILCHSKKYKQAKKSPTNALIQHEKQEHKRQVMTQNLKHMIRSCSEVITIYYKEIKKFGVSSNGFSLLDTSLQSSPEQIPKDFINSILTLWSQHELQHCYQQFVMFISTVVRTFPQHVILLESNPEFDKKFMTLLQEIGSVCQNYNLEHEFVDIVEYTMAYLCDLDIKKGKQMRELIYLYFVRFQDQWKILLQYLQGVMYGKKCVENQSSELAIKVNNVYDIVDKMLKDSHENMDVQI